MSARRRIVLIAAVAALGAALGFGGVLESCQPANKAPLARFSFTPKEPIVGQPVTFDGSASKDPDGKIVSYLWDFGDGQTAQEIIVTHAFQKDGEYDVTLQVTDDRGASSQLTKTVHVMPPNRPPVARFTVNPDQPKAGEPVTLDASESSDPDGTIAQYSWDFGDQETGEGKIVTHVYKSAGTYTVTLTVTDDKNAKASTTQQITVAEAPPNEPPFAKFDFTPAVAVVDQPVVFDASESRDDGEIVRYEWEFGDGTTGEGRTVSHPYRTAGTFVVKLTVIDNLGATGSTTRSVLVREAQPPAPESFAAPGGEPSGLTWDGKNFWASDTDNGKLYKLDPKDGRVIGSLAGPGSDPVALAWDGQALWVLDNLNERVYQIDPKNGTVLGEFATPGSDPVGIAWDGEHLWLADADTNKLYKLDTTGNELGSFNLPGEAPTGLGWDGTHLWLSDSTIGLIRIDPNTGKQLSTKKAPGPDPRGLAWDGKYLWVLDGEDLKVYRVTP